MTNKEKFLQLVSKEKTNTVARARERKMNRAVLRRSQEIALTILERLDVLGWTQKRLAEEMGIQPQQVNRWLKGSENFSLSTLVHLEEVLKVSLIGSQREQRILEMTDFVFVTGEYTYIASSKTNLKTATVIKEQREYHSELTIAV